MKIRTLGEDFGYQVIQRVTGERPQSVEVEQGPNMLTLVFRARTTGGLRRYLFEGDSETPPEHGRDAAREICWHEGCWEAVDPRARVTGGAAWRVCGLHRAAAPSAETPARR
jgi:hypothetical protein